MSDVTVTFGPATGLKPVNVPEHAVQNTVTGYLQSLFPAVDEVQYDAVAHVGVMFVGNLLVGAFTTTPTGGAA